MIIIFHLARYFNEMMIADADFATADLPSTIGPAGHSRSVSLAKMQHGRVYFTIDAYEGCFACHFIYF